MGTQTWPKASVAYLVVPDDVVAEQGYLLTKCLQKWLKLALRGSSFLGATACGGAR